MSAPLPELKPIATAVMTRPAFDNTQLASFRLWIEDNTNALARYWHEQGNALGLGKDEDTDFDFWLRVQYDIEVQSRRPDSDPTPWCAACGARTKARCHCGPIAENE